MAGRKKIEGAPVSARTLQRRAKEADAAKLLTKAAPAPTAKAKPAKKRASKLVSPVALVDHRSPEMKAIDEKLLARLSAAIDAAPPSVEALSELVRLRRAMLYDY